MKHYGDITKINGAGMPIVDIVTGGSPCQDLSVAGKRAGLAGERSGLFMEQIRIIKEMREHDRANGWPNKYIRPRFMVWENVCGAFSSNKGEDFRAVLEETARVADKDAVIPGPPKGKWTPAGCIMADGWSIAWRVHDAQFWGVPQRRKRISLVADFGGATAPEILFEREGLSRDIEESREEGQGITTDSKGCLNPASFTLKIRGGVDTDSSGKKAGKSPLVQTELSATLGVSQDQTLITRCLNPWDVQSKHVQPENGIAESLYAGECRGGGGESYVMQQKVFGICSDGSNSMRSDNPHAGIYEADTTRTLDMNGGNPACNQGGMIVVEGVDGYNQTTTGVKAMSLTSGRADDHHIPCVVIEGNGSRPSHKVDGYSESETMYTLNSTEHHAVAVESHANDSRVKISEDGTVQTLSSRMGTGGNNVSMVMYPEKTTGSLMASGYDKLGTQEAMNDMFVVESSAWDGSQVSPTLTANNANGGQRMPDKDNFNAVLTYGLDRAAYNQGMNTQFDFAVDVEKIGTQVAKGPGAVCNDYVVRRLTPLECERLQGFPDGWTDIGDWVDSKGKKHKGESDAPRYKALGNSIALPFWEWMAKRMRKYLGDKPTMASLFSGIGGFELSFYCAGVKPVWSSEIEDYPNEVVKIHFGDDDKGTKGDIEKYV